MKKVDLIIIAVLLGFSAILLSMIDGKGLLRKLDDLEVYYYHEYPDYYEVTEWLLDFAEAHPEICMAESLGYSTTDSLTIWGLKISDNPAIDEDEITALVNGSIHAEEIVGTAVCQFIAETLAASYGLDSAITEYVDNFEFWIVPIVNPDGYQVILEGLDYTYRKNKRDNNENGIFNYVFYHANDTDGVDINRNFPFNWNGPDAVPDWHSSYYRGASPASEEETKAMVRLCEREKFTFSIWYHSSSSGTFNEKVIYPYKYQDTIVCLDQSRNGGIAYRYSSYLQKEEGGGYLPQISKRMHGNAPDWEYYKFGTCSFMTEIGTTTQPPWEIVEFQQRNHFKGINYLFDRTLNQEMLAIHVYDSTTHEPLKARVEIEGHYREDLTAPRYTDSLYGAHYRLIMADDHTIWVSKDGYEDRYIDITIERGIPYTMNVGLVREAAIDEEYPISHPNNLEIESVSPNPFNGACEISLNKSSCANNTLHISSLDGKIVEQLNFKGQRQIIWHPKKSVESGIYLISLSNNSQGNSYEKAIYIK